MDKVTVTVKLAEALAPASGATFPRPLALVAFMSADNVEIGRVGGGNIVDARTLAVPKPVPAGAVKCDVYPMKGLPTCYYQVPLAKE